MNPGDKQYTLMDTEIQDGVNKRTLYQLFTAVAKYMRKLI
jgi:hypothetical protein